MTLKTVTVTGQIYNPDGTPAAGVEGYATLNRPETDNGIVIPTSTFIKADEAGQFSIQLWPNARGSGQSQYIVKAYTRRASVLNLVIMVPDVDVPVAITDIAIAQPYPPIDQSLQALLDVQAASVIAQAAKVEALEAEAGALASAQSAAGSATSAGQSAQTAGTKAQEASTSAQLALESKNAAALSEQNAGEAKDDAVAAKEKAEAWAENPEDVEVEAGQYSAKHHAIKAEQYALTAAQSKADAEAAKVIAEEKALAASGSATLAGQSASNAAESALSASEDRVAAQEASGLAVGAQTDIHTNWQGKLDTAAQQAETATTQAVIATDKAAEASGSAATANAAKTAAEAARDAAMVGAVTYPDEATGRAAAADGEYFKVIGSGDVAAREYRRTNATTSVLVAEYPSVVAVDTLGQNVNEITEIVGTSGASSLPAIIFADKDEKVFAQINDDGQLYLLSESESVQSKLERTNEINNGSESVFSAHDADGKSVIQVDKKGRLFTAGARRSIQDSAASNYLFRAMRHEKAGNHLLAKYWYDVAENELKMPIFMSAVVAPTGADGAIQRIPAITKVSDGRLLCIWQQIKRPGGSGDAEGVRLAQCYVDYDLEVGSITVGERSIFEEPADWASNLGFIGHPHLITLPTGRIICAYNVNDEASGLAATYILNIYMRYSDDGGVTWSAKQKIADAPGDTVPRIIAPGSTGDFVRIPAGIYEGRIVFPYWVSIGGPLGAMYSDDDGLTWTKGTGFNTTNYQGNECGIAVLPDNSLLMNIRTEGFFEECYALSNDGGATWEFKGPKSDWQASNCARSTVQSSFSPDDGYSKILWSGLDNSQNYHRSGLVLRVSHDDGLTYQCQYHPVPKEKAAGYSNIKMIAPDFFAVAWESGFNNDCSMMVYIANLAEVYKNGSNY